MHNCIVAIIQHVPNHGLNCSHFSHCRIIYKNMAIDLWAAATFNFILTLDFITDLFTTVSTLNSKSELRYVADTGNF